MVTVGLKGVLLILRDRLALNQTEQSYELTLDKP